jgi:alpha-ketoglutarate-dependent taurine dioxygenase
MDIRPIGTHVGAEVSGIDTTGPIAPEAVAALRGALARHGVLVFRGQPIDDAAQVAFSRCFGPLEVFVSKEHTNRAFPEVMEIADVGDTTKWLSTALLWHTDGSYKAVPSYVTALRAVLLPPEGGETWFCNTAAAYEALPEAEKRRIAGLRVVHDLAHSRSLVPGLPPLGEAERAAVPAAEHPLVKAHAGTGQKVLYLGCHAREVVGMPLEEGRALLRELERWATQPRFVYRHRWRIGDLVIWDNRGTMHRATAYDASKHRRVMHRTEVSGRDLPLAA